MLIMELVDRSNCLDDCDPASQIIIGNRDRKFCRNMGILVCEDNGAILVSIGLVANDELYEGSGLSATYDDETELRRLTGVEWIDIMPTFLLFVELNFCCP